jgi:hypothetical protein
MFSAQIYQLKGDFDAALIHIEQAILYVNSRKSKVAREVLDLIFFPLIYPK